MHQIYTGKKDVFKFFYTIREKIGILQIFFEAKINFIKSLSIFHRNRQF